VFGMMASDPSGTRVEAIVLRTDRSARLVVRVALPAGMRVLSGELADIDILLDDARLFDPFRAFFDPGARRARSRPTYG